MRRVAFLTADCMFEDSPAARSDAYEHQLEFAALQPACKGRLIALEEQIWDAEFNPADYDALVVGTCWDYMEKPDAFMAALVRFDRASRLFNPLPLMQWNMRKTYLKSLEEKGAAVVPTLWVDRADAKTLGAAFDQLGCEEIVAKPVLGASAWRQARLKRGDPLPPADELPPGETMIQPFLPAALEEGEFSFVFCDGVFSHALRKVPAKGDYRVQSVYGGHEEDYDPSAEEVERAFSVLQSAPGEALYGRVDMMRLPEGMENGGALAVMELELIEPYLYPEQGPYLGAHFAAALDRFLSRPSKLGADS